MGRTRRHPRPQPSTSGFALLALGVALVGVGVASDLVLFVLWGAVPLALLALDRLWAEWLARHLSPGVGAGRGLTVRWRQGDDTADRDSSSPNGPDGQPPEVPSGAVGEPLALGLRVELPRDVPLRDLRLRPVASGALTLLPESASVTARGDGHGVGADFTAVAARVGEWRAFGVQVTASSPLGLHRAVAYHPATLSLKAFPRWVTSRAGRTVRQTRSTPQEGVDRTPRPRRGLSSELKELRDHVPGDPFKHIAWKATARTGRLIVREFETELSLSLYIALDLSPSMREGPPGSSPLDQAINIAYTVASELARGRDRVGLLAFDSRVLAFRRAQPGRKALTGVVDDLMGVHQMVHEELTAVTYGELVVRVAEYLERQHGLRTRPRTNNDRDLIPDPALVLSLAEGLQAPPGTRARWPAEELARNEDSARLRSFCQRHGVELPYRPTCSPSERGVGFLRAFERVVQTGGGPHVLLLLTDLTAGHSLDDLVRGVRLARSRRSQVLVLIPEAPRSPTAILGETVDPDLAVLADVYDEDERRTREHAAQTLRKAGARVLPLTDVARLSSAVRRLRGG